VDEIYMRRALELAGKGRYGTSPNPMVGCVIVLDGRIIGEGFHSRAGEAHAEIEALRVCSESPAGATVYVTLEPCSHEGRTGPCVDALIAAGVARVVAAVGDPDSLVDGTGFRKLAEAGISVEEGLLSREAEAMNEVFLYTARHRRPFVILKAAVTLDGKLATVDRDSRWISGEAARERSLGLREEVDAILVGGGTVKADDPQLTRRLGLSRSITPWTRVVVDADGDLSPAARLLSDGGRTLLFTTHPQNYVKSDALEVIAASATAGRIDLDWVFQQLYDRGIRSLLVEGGSLLHSDLIVRRLWQKMIVFIAPMVIGGGSAPALFGGEAIVRLTDAYRFRFDRAEMVGDDVMIVGYPSIDN
jgi:diaminohydroxyphosphoribosylaminopyrimidine deaminase / 5-amino-6-(5-phosphoribosylamino)uracil reductase